MKTYKVVFSRLYEVPEHEVEKVSASVIEEADNKIMPNELDDDEVQEIKNDIAIGIAQSWLIGEIEERSATGDRDSFSGEITGFNED